MNSLTQILSLIKSKVHNRIKPFYLYLVCACLIYLGYSGFRQLVTSNHINIGLYNSFIHLYSNSLLYFVQLLQNISGLNPFVNYQTNDIISNPYLPLHVDYFYLSFKHLFIILAIGLVTPAPILARMKFIGTGFSLIFVYNVLRIACLSVYIHSSVFLVLFNFSMLLRKILVMALIYFFWEHYPSIKNSIIKQLSINERRYKSLYFMLVIIFVLAFLVETLIFGTYIRYNAFFIAKVLLNISQWISALFGYTSIIAQSTLKGYGTWVYMDNRCLGIDLMLLFAGFIFLIPGKWFHKLWFIPTGILAIFCINALRVSIVFMHLANQGGHYSLPVEIHNLFTYPVYILTFLMWAFWINKFQLDPSKKLIS